MIDVQPYIDKLDKLREYMFIRIDNQPFDVWVDLQVCPTKYYTENGLNVPIPYIKTIRFAPNSFDEYLVNEYTKLTWNSIPQTLLNKLTNEDRNTATFTDR